MYRPVGSTPHTTEFGFDCSAVPVWVLDLYPYPYRPPFQLCLAVQLAAEQRRR
ncbi:predicted protein [Plenodomus lingam JN3]|uniref:Predicted protein n=1 Tax=Leptosphaeria maculans (strain JN3 / isolate v23.1.3 / race Av1-4-5-6-7-8) TaxID=985895 RepID=E4ZKD0_LEPMJ|nr:predicted protein [Plenodomus lingam JN3]CBX91725.1 predicted protein [Plenodomus lingam JN3]